LQGDIYVYEDGTVTNGVPQTASEIHAKVLLGTSNQSRKASTSISNTDYWLLTHLYAAVVKKQGAQCDIEFQSRIVSESSPVFRNFLAAAVTDTAPYCVELDPVIIIRKNSDYRVRASSDTASTGVYAYTHGYLAQVISTGH
jgi:hypothetical protein